jgi:hypothetical protein
MANGDEIIENKETEDVQFELLKQMYGLSCAAKPHVDMILDEFVLVLIMPRSCSLPETEFKTGEFQDLGGFPLHENKP